MDWKYIKWRLIRAPWFFFNHPYRKEHDDFCKLIIENKEKFKWHSDGYLAIGEKENGDRVSFWIANKFYAYAQSVVFYHSETQTYTSKTNGRPSLKTIYHLYNDIEKNIRKTKADEDRRRDLNIALKVLE